MLEPKIHTPGISVWGLQCFPKKQKRVLAWPGRGGGVTIWLLHWGVLKVVVKGREIQGRRFGRAKLELTTYTLWLLEMASFFWDRSLGVFMFMYILIKAGPLFRGCTISADSLQQWRIDAWLFSFQRNSASSGKPS